MLLLLRSGVSVEQGAGLVQGTYQPARPDSTATLQQLQPYRTAFAAVCNSLSGYFVMHKSN